MTNTFNSLGKTIRKYFNVEYECIEEGVYYIYFSINNNDHSIEIWDGIVIYLSSSSSIDILRYVQKAKYFNNKLIHDCYFRLSDNQLSLLIENRLNKKL